MIIIKWYYDVKCNSCTNKFSKYTCNNAWCMLILALDNISCFMVIDEDDDDDDDGDDDDDDDDDYYGV